MYFHDQLNWTEWRDVFDGGDNYTRKYLQKFTERETDQEYQNRLSLTPTPSYAKTAVTDIRNAIFQRMRDITRIGGSSNYNKAVAGEMGGVDLKGNTMNGFIGVDVLTELLVMGKVGVYVDMPVLSGPTLADIGGAKPYLYRYQVEDILAWSTAYQDDPNKFSAVLLRDTGYDFAQHAMYGIKLPVKEYLRYRLLWLDDSGFVNLQFFNQDGEVIDSHGNITADLNPTVLELRQIPFVLFDIGDSVLKDVSKHQAALLNLGSSDVAYALKANYPFYTEQADLRDIGSHLRHGVNEDGTATTGGQRASEHEIKVGATQGRRYGMNAERPGFIHPSPEPLKASIQLQEKLEDDIRKLVNLAVNNKIGTRVSSAEALKMSDQGLEAGLSYIGMGLEHGERKLANFWSAYEEKRPEKRKVPTIKYPDRYSLKTDVDRIDEAERLSKLTFTVPSQTAKREIAKNVVAKLFTGYIDTETMDKITSEIDKSHYATSDPNIIVQAAAAGLVSEKTASQALGFSADEYLQARIDHAERAKRILEAQSEGKEAARGVPDMSASRGEGSAERAEATDTTLKDSKEKPERGEGKNTKEDD